MLKPCMATLMALLAIVPAASAAPRRGDRTSWGRPGVSLDRYRTDAVACNKAGGLMDIRDADATRMFVAGHEIENRALNLPPIGGTDAQRFARQVFHPQRQIDRVADLQSTTTETCLTNMGYRRFRLTPAQGRRLAALPKGTPARHAYLHSLASDPGILDRQALTPRRAD